MPVRRTKSAGSHGIHCSMSRKGECLDNAVAERFFGSLKARAHGRIVTMRPVKKPGMM